MAKRLIDILGSLLALAILSPVLLLIGLAVKLDSPGPMFYLARRVGRAGVHFRMYKFRTMVVDADRKGPGLTCKDDARVTRLGKVLRRVRLDELPQLLNVVRGEMSLVGPRPEAPEYVDLRNPLWLTVLSVRPGICGQTQLAFAFDEAELLKNSAEADRDYVHQILPAKLAMDADYVRRQSLRLDLGLMVLTALALVRVRVAAPRKALDPMRQVQPALPFASVKAQGLAPAIGGRYTLMLLDAGAVAFSFVLALGFRFDGRFPEVYVRQLLLALPLVIAAFVAANLCFGLYRRAWRYTGSSEAITIGAASVVGTALVLLATALWSGSRPVPIGVALMGGVLSGVLFTAARYRRRLLTGLMGRVQRIVGSPDRQRVLIVGAGEAGHLIAQQLGAGANRGRYELVGFVDDDPRKRRLLLHGAAVLGDRGDIPRIVAECGVGLVIVAIHRVDGPALRDILATCLTTPARVKMLPNFLGAIEQSRGVLPLRDISAEDLLGRQLCAVDEGACRHIIAGKVVLVTGASGSIGSELCRQILALGPRTLLMLDNNETGLHDLFISLRCPDGSQALPLVADVTSQARVESIFERHRPQLVFHAAAYKHVPLMEHHPDEAVRVNVLGAAIVSELAARHGVERFVFISTDKAVDPSSIMGATKRVGELLMMASAEQTQGIDGRSLFTAVRFGNVLGSRGSVVPTFVRQIDAGGPVTITHPEMTRFFISISEAVSLVIQAATMTVGGDIFMLDMGQPIRIEELAHKLIRLRGLRPGEDIPIVYTGARPGEKLHEQLTSPDEEQLATDHPKLFRIRSQRFAETERLAEQVAGLVELAAGQRVDELVGALWRLVRADTVPQALEIGADASGAAIRSRRDRSAAPLGYPPLPAPSPRAGRG